MNKYIVTCFIIWLIDSSFLPIKEKTGIVTNKYIIPSHTTTTFIQSGKVLVPITNHYDTEYCIDVSIDGLCDDFELCELNWRSIKINQPVYCKYTTGRILKSLYIKDIQRQL